MDVDDIGLLELILLTLDHPLFYSNKATIKNRYPLFESNSEGTYLVSCHECWEQLYKDLKYLELHLEIDQNYHLGMI